MKVLIKLFQKFAQVEGAKPSSRPQARNLFSPFFGSFLRLLRQKRTETVSSHKNPRVNRVAEDVD
ncbi:MAG: hypothetical protein J6R46_04885, partial [Clostridia bacterium]|nr:hypothetical protein [Clostridia bacterium]